MKENLHQQCIDELLTRIERSREAIAIARESANEDGKSSAGDKHETGRSMAQLEQEKSARQLIELEDQLEQLRRIEFKNSEMVVKGSLVKTSMGNFYLSVGLGKVGECFAISPSSPVGAAMLGKSKGDEFKVNNNTFTIQEIS